MELRQLEYFIAVAEEANFTRAAERVRISQSGVSAQIRQLEHELGATLLDRSSRTVTVTGAGAVALEHARGVLASVDTLRRAVDDVTGLIRGRVVVGMVTGCTIAPFFEALAAFHADHPGVALALYEENSDRLVDAVRTGAADLALVGAAGTTPPGLESFSIVSEGLIAVVPVDHPLAQGDRRAGTVGVTLGELSKFPLVCLPGGTGIRTVFDEACVAAGVTPDVALQATAPAVVADLAIRGLGVAILSESMAEPYGGRVAALPIVDIDAPALLAVVWRATRNPAVSALVGRCRAAFGQDHR